ncbi:MAG TPA: hypothetical protein DEF41_03765 [Desulfovibrio sp.]|uniref:Uncharacterized protein n=1 Tax=Nitratidesulfovibrio vulgaris (strain ATCC 29579 / DSM 644 / CCUG 34227 / NCIMB 8303 / VKM B-1760 / Hildenborough) TaxID=882 RepID=Q72DE4_NITV2|nr:hypothetical protein DVU_0985 [Nitratidesulfovibrio vulgaris str. Hildenborough]HBW15260.1 hypothetical protein [Desulfovibrio sp.]
MHGGYRVGLRAGAECVAGDCAAVPVWPWHSGRVLPDVTSAAVPPVALSVVGAVLSGFTCVGFGLVLGRFESGMVTREKEEGNGGG